MGYSIDKDIKLSIYVDRQRLWGRNYVLSTVSFEFNDDLFLEHQEVRYDLNYYYNLEYREQVLGTYDDIDRHLHVIEQQLETIYLFCKKLKIKFESNILNYNFCDLGGLKKEFDNTLNPKYNRNKL